MPKRSGKKQDINERAFAIVQQISGESQVADSERTKNPAAVALGRLGGLKGGKARAAKLSEKQRIQIARKAAKARWEK
jgi:hypothetical protein